MSISLSKTQISSFVGDVLPLYLVDGDNDLSNSDIMWTASGESVQIRSFAHDPLTPFTHGVLITLKKEGEGEVTATYLGEQYTCRVFARAAKCANDNDDFQYYRGDLHTHTATTHTPAKFAAQPHIQADCINTLASDARLDFGILSDHASVMRRRGFFDEFVELETVNPTDTVIFPGSESEVTVMETDRFGLPHKHSGEIVCLGMDNSSSVKSWEEFEADMTVNSLSVGIFAHPFVLGVGPNSLWSFPYDRIRTPHLLSLMRGIEMGSGSQNGGSLLFEYAYSAALDNGFSVSPTCSSDCHGPGWGFDAMRGKTILMAQEKSREAFQDALRNNRFYACESANVKLVYTVNGEVAPAHLSPTDTYDFHIEFSYFEQDDTTRPTYLEVISDYGEAVYTCNGFDNVVEFTLKSETARYFYLRILDENGRKTWSAPIWTGREFDTPRVSNEAITPLNGDEFTATEVQTGADAQTAIDGDPGVAFESTLPVSSILIDMKKEYNVCAIGYWARRFTKDWIKETAVDHWKTEIGPRMLDITKRYVTEYSISTSIDGINFTPCTSGVIRAFGDEEIFRFTEHRARFVRFDATSTIGAQSKIPSLADSPIAIGELSIFGS